MGGVDRVAAQTARAHEQLNKAVRAGIIDQREMNVLLGQARDRFVDASRQAAGFRTELRAMAQLAAGSAVAQAVPGVGGFMLGSAIGRRGLGLGFGVAGAVAGGAATVQLAQTGDQLRLLEAQLRAFSGGSAEAERAFAGLLATSRETDTALQSNAVLLRRLTQAQKDLGASTDEVIQFQETVQKLMVASGQATTEAAAGTLQLAQALASGRVQGDEFRSIMENMTEVARAAAQGLYEMGVLTEPTIGALNELREAGALTAKDFFQAILTQGPRANQVFAQMPDTIGRATASVGNELFLFAGHLAEATGATDAFIGALRGIESALKVADRALAASRGFFDQWGAGVETNIRAWELLLEKIPGISALVKEPIGVDALKGLGQAADEIGGLFTALQGIRQLPELKPLEAVEISEEQVRLQKEAAQEAERLRKEAERLAETRREGAASLRAEAADLERLLAAHAKGEGVYKAEKLAVEGLEAARRVGLDLSTEEGRAYATLAANVADLTARLREEEEQRERLDALKMASFESMNEEEMRRRMGQAAAGGLSRPGEPEAKELPEAWKNALEDIQGMFTDTFQDLTKGVITDFEDMATAVTDIFSRMAANVATLSFSPRPEDQRAFKELAESIHVSARGLQALALAPSVIGTAIGAFGGQQARQGANLGMGIGSALGAGIGMIPGVPGGPVVGSMVGALGGQVFGGLFGGLFGDENRGRVQMPRGGLGFAGAGGTGQAAEFVRTLDRRLIELMDARQELLIDQALRQAPGVQVKFQEQLSAGDMMRLAAGRIGPAAGALGFNVAGVTGGTAEEQFANLQRAIELLKQIEAFEIGPVATQFRDLNEQFAEMAEQAGRLGISMAGLPAAHQRAAEALERQIRQQKIQVAEQVGAATPLDAALQNLALQMDEARAQALALGISTANLAITQATAAAELERASRLQQIAIAEAVGAITPLNAALQTLEVNLQGFAAQALTMGIPLTNLAATHQQRAEEIRAQFAASDAARVRAAEPEITPQQRIAAALEVGALRPIDAALRTLQEDMRDAAAEAVRLGISTRSVAAEHRRLADELLREHRAAQTTVAERVGALDPITAALRLLEVEMQSAAAEASRLGVSTAAVREQHRRLADEQIRQFRVQQNNIALQVGALDPFTAMLRTLEAEMQSAAAEAARLGVSTAAVREQHKRLAEEQIRDFRLQQIGVAERVGAMTPLNAALESLWIEMQKAAFEASRLGVSTANVAQEHKRLADELIRETQATQDRLALSIVDPFKQLSEPLREFQLDLEFALLNPLNQAQRARDEFRRIAALATSGDTQALQQVQQAGQFYIEQMGRFGASPGQVAATQEVASVVASALDQIEQARRQAESGLENEIRLASQREVDTLYELIAEVRLVGEEIKRLRR